jgi:hypothetical protein
VRACTANFRGLVGALHDLSWVSRCLDSEPSETRRSLRMLAVNRLSGGAYEHRLGPAGKPRIRTTSPASVKAGITGPGASVPSPAKRGSANLWITPFRQELQLHFIAHQERFSTT